jgi:eukaryotic-like serine/threonine-protein kinase
VPDPIASLPAFDPAQLVGTTLDGRYLIEEHLATGGMGAVFRGRHVYMRKDVALKVLRPDLSASSELVERFRREAEIAASLEHENIVRVTDFGRTPEGWLFLAMELLFGESLFDRLRREGFLPPGEAVTILWEVCAGLEAAHARGVVHRDLKPENVFLARTPSGREVVKILDFGIAKIADPSSDSATQAGMVVGTPEYLSPEQATGSAVDGRADLYTVGLIAWRMLTGRHPFKAEDARSLLMMQATKPVPAMTDARPDLADHPMLLSVVARACAKDPGIRYQTASDLKADLAGSLGAAFQAPLGATPDPRISLTDLATLQPPEPSDTVPLGSGRTGLVRRATDPELAPVPVPAVKSPVPASGLPWVSAHPVLAIALGAVVVALVLLMALVGRPGSTAAPAPAAVASSGPGPAPPAPQPPPGDDDLTLAQQALTAGRAREARALLEALLVKHPGEVELLRLLGHAFHGEGEEGKAIDAWAGAQALAPMDPAALAHLASDLARDRPVADKAARLLVKVGPAARPALKGALAATSTQVRLRALAVAREIGPGGDLDVLGGYLALLDEPDCDVRKAAAHGLRDLGDRRALAKLRTRAAEHKEKRGLFGVLIESTPVCGAVEAGEAVRKIEAR